MKFLAIFIGAASEADKSGPSAEQSQRFIEDWGRWFGIHEAAIVDSGTPLGKTLRVKAAGTTGARNAMVAYMIVEAPNHDEAVRIFTDHPHLGLLPGNAIEVMECLSVPS